MITKVWGQQTFYLGSKHIALLGLLGIPALTSHFKEEGQSIAESLQQSPHSEEDKGLADLGFTTTDEGDTSMDGSKDMSRQDVDVSIEPRCVHCDTVFRDKTQESLEEIFVHLGEVHYEVDLDTEQKKLFPNLSNRCEDCNCEIKGDYVQREHILLTHPWSSLKSTAEEIFAVVGNQELSTKEEINNDMLLEEAICTKKYDVTESTIGEEESSNNLISQQIDEFIQSLSCKSDKPVIEHLDNQNQSQVILAGKEQVDKTTISCQKCTYKWTYHSGTRMSDLKSRIKTHVVDLHLQEELASLIKNFFVADACQACGETLQSLTLQKKHIRKSHGALESDILSIVEAILGDDFHKKDPLKNKRKGSPKPESSRKRRAKKLSNQSGVTSALSKEFLQNANFSDTDNMDNAPDMEGIYQSNLDSKESKACNDIQQAIEFSDSDDE